MTAYIIRRFVQAGVVVILASILVFLMIRLLPGDPVLLYVSMDEFNEVTTKEELDALRHEFGLDRPMYIQYADWIGGVVRGDLGDSIFLNVAVSEEMGNALPKTFFLGVVAWIIAVFIGVPFGIIAAVRRGSWADTIVTTSANVGITAPIFWIGILLIWLFGITLGWLPVMGYTSIFSEPLMAVRQMIMPVFCLALFPMSGLARQTRSAMLEVIRQDYIRTAWAKGLTEMGVIMKHAIRNGIIPVVTLAGLQIRGILGGSVLIESVFNIPGMGRLAVEGLQNQDYAIVQGVVLLIATTTVLLNLIVDISYGYLDPRIRYS
ncbi:MAG: ABC transporter permease [Deltaproteobacteria bacterium]|nr:ABC transporter permease [Deltaproteobacteria bacterium]